MKTKLVLFIAMAVVVAALAPNSATARQQLYGHVPEVIARLHLQPVGSLPGTNRLNLAIGLPLRNAEAMTNLLQQLYDPHSTNYHQYLSPAQFTRLFGPTASDYDGVVSFARSNGWVVAKPDPGRLLVDVNASVADIERVCHVKMRTYQHPTEQRTFFAPDTEPSLDLAIPVRDIAGLDNYFRPRPASLHTGRRQRTSPGAGSGPGGSFVGYDFRAAYAPGVQLDGSGQTLGLLEFDGYYTNDIQTYEVVAGLPDVPLNNELLDSFDGVPSNYDYVGEVSLDIEMAISMAPGLSQVIVYEAGPDGIGDDVLEQMANDGTATEISSSWFFDVDSNTTVYLQRLAMQGQSFFEASGDELAYSGGVTFEEQAGPPADNPYVTSVGGTTLTTTGAGGPWTSETTWNNYTSGEGTNGSSGGISDDFPIQSWQQDTSMAANGGSPTQRNVPDVAMTADGVWVISDDGETNWFWGTSCAAPLWAGFAALVNEQAASYGRPPVGFINPAIYAQGNSPQYNAVFHDITTGNNTNNTSTNLFFACPGYDLCTGWGTPTGINLINALALADPLLISPATGFSTGGAAGGPFHPAEQTFYLTNPGPVSLGWSAKDASSLLTVSPASGILAAGQGTSIKVSLAASADSLSAGFYPDGLIFSNLNLNAEQIRQFNIQVGLPPLNFDDLDSDPNWNEIPAGYGGISWSNFYVMAGTTYEPSGYEAGMISSPNVIYNGNAHTASIRSPAPFDLLSAYLTAAWDDNLIVVAHGYIGSTLAYNLTNTLSATAPTVVQFNFFGVTAVNFLVSGGTRHSGYSGSGRYFVMDNAEVVPHPAAPAAPQLQNANPAGGAISLDWNATMGQTYQLQYSTNLASTNWADLAAPLTATNSILTASDIATNLQRYYRLLLLP